MKKKQKKLKEMRYHQVQSTPFVQPTVHQTLLAAALLKHKRWEAPPLTRFWSISLVHPQD